MVESYHLVVSVGGEPGYRSPGLILSYSKNWFGPDLSHNNLSDLYPEEWIVL